MPSQVEDLLAQSSHKISMYTPDFPEEGGGRNVQCKESTIIPTMYVRTLPPFRFIVLTLCVFVFGTWNSVIDLALFWAFLDTLIEIRL
jgi:hypothetical protein